MKMFNKIFFGITNRCNLKCFTCNREVLDNYQYPPETSLEMIDNILQQTNEIIYIGEMGDFIFHPLSLEIADLTVNKHNKFMRTDTNGNFRNDDYWKNLANITSQNDSNIRFMIDSLKFDYHRVNSDIKRVLRNLKTFIDAGGNAHVKTILFNFNYNEISEMTKVFKDMGVQKYVNIKSRFYLDEGPLSAPPATKSSLELFDKISVGFKSVKECPWGKYRNCYINEHGEVKVCCHLVFEGLAFASGINKDWIKPYIGIDMFDDLLELYNDNKHLINLNTEGVTLESAYNNIFNQTLINYPNRFKICKYRCNLPNNLKDKLLYDTEIF